MFSVPTPLPDDPVALQLILRAAAAEIERLRLLLASLRRNRFGRRSERLDDDQLEQGIDDLEQSLAEQQRDWMPRYRRRSPRRRIPRPHPDRRDATGARCPRICPGSRW